MRDVQPVDGKWGRTGVRDEFLGFMFDEGQSSYDLLGCPQRFPKFVEIAAGDKRNCVACLDGMVPYLEPFGLKYHFRTFGWKPECGEVRVPGLQTINIPKGAKYLWVMDWMLRNTSAKEFVWMGADGADPKKCPDKYIATWFHQKRIDCNPGHITVRPAFLVAKIGGGWKQVGEDAVSSFEFVGGRGPSWLDRTERRKRERQIGAVAALKKKEEKACLEAS